MEALAAMGRFLRSRPTSFDSLEVCLSCFVFFTSCFVLRLTPPPPKSAIKWSLNTGQLRSREAARVSMPPQLKPIEVSASTAAASNVSELAEEEPGETEESAEQAEAGSGSGSDASAAVAKTVTRYTWRIDLSATGGTCAATHMLLETLHSQPLSVTPPRAVLGGLVQGSF